MDFAALRRLAISTWLLDLATVSMAMAPPDDPV
jgi:hypothetical protein